MSETIKELNEALVAFRWTAQGVLPSASIAKRAVHAVTEAAGAVGASPGEVEQADRAARSMAMGLMPSQDLCLRAIREVEVLLMELSDRSRLAARSRGDS